MNNQVKFTAEEFATILKSVTRNGAAYAKGIGKALLAALYFSIVECNAKPATELVASLRKSTKQGAVMAILEEHGNLAWMKSDKVPHFEHFDAQHVWMEEDVKALREVCENWEDFKPAVVEKPYDVVAAVEAILKSVESKVKNSKKVENAALAAPLKAALAKYTAQAALETVKS